MNGKVVTTITGNLTADPELKFTPKGAAVMNFTVASTPRIYDANTGKWRDGEALFMRCTAWRDLAENMGESRIGRGTRVTVTGTLSQRSWEDDQGNKRTVIELDAEEVAASMRFAHVAVKRIRRDIEAPGQPARHAPEQDEKPPF
ncbi:single-stranded DNA-binding protein [Nocardia flavorosea]|uniref:Single-stranded DNA-binding protein n=1 Tax=Nocardia flavorosea TaxID=53429 RepID=A0A846YPG7_9NOCA|nr:single-stranded DNA-binding protein [Nocardia flavorosea]NKY60997.1 single-stranded DNA-binding protein [Nocardia flavorosea]